MSTWIFSTHSPIETSKTPPFWIKSILKDAQKCDDFVLADLPPFPPPNRFSSYMWMGTPHEGPCFCLIKFYAQHDVWCFNLLGRFGDDLPIFHSTVDPKMSKMVTWMHLANIWQNIMWNKLKQTLMVGHDLKDRQEGTRRNMSFK